MSTTIAASLFAVAMTVSAAGAMIIDASTIQIITVAALSAVAPTILALATLRQSMANGRTAILNDKKTDDLIEKTDVIHTLANSNLTRVSADLVSANERIAALEDLLKQLIAKETPKKPR